ncbi:OadG family protein [Pseudalgibacter alginicilyticus]|nr:OadG family protein [Pseudalgibacter alginicilyticus]
MILLYNDPIEEGYVILITGLLIVFGGLILLTIFFKYALPVMLDAYIALKQIGVKKEKELEISKPKVDKREFTGEVTAAISVAIHMYLKKQHDEENAVLTIKQARKLYSPWSSKIYGTQGNRL